MERVLVICTILLSIYANAQEVNHEPEMADFISNINRYIRWGNLDEISKEFTIGVVRDNDMATRLSEMYAKKTFLGKKVKIIEFYMLDEIEPCEILFLSDKVFVTDKTLSFVNAKINGHQTLVISNDAKRIGMINFYNRNYDNSLCYEVNITSIENAGLIPQRALLKDKKASIKRE